MDTQTILAFGMAYLAFSASPGPNKLAIMSNAMRGGSVHGIAFGAGIVAITLGFFVFTTAGFAAVAVHLSKALWVAQYLGAAYLIYRGAAMWSAEPATLARPLAGGVGRLFMLGLLLAASNPITPIFFIAVLPGLLGAGPVTPADIAILLGIVCLIEAIAIGGYVAIGQLARTAFCNFEKLKLVNRAAGLLLAASGALIALRSGLGFP